MTASLCFIDTETDGVHPDRKAWEVAMIRRDENGTRFREFFVEVDLSTADPFGLKVGGFYDRHPLGRRISGGSAACKGQYDQINDGSLPGPEVFGEADAALKVAEFTHGAHLVGAVPNFDADVLARLLRDNGLTPSWHYHLVDVEAMAVGYLRAARAGKKCRHANQRGIYGDEINARHGARAECLDCGALLPNLPISLPWKSDSLSLACGVEPPEGSLRHTAMGDAEWAMNWYDAMTGGTS